MTAVRMMYANHNTDAGLWCRFSLVSAPAYAKTSDHCPAECSHSWVIDDPRPVDVAPEEAEGDCEHCGEAPEWLRGILLGANGPETVEECSGCDRYDNDFTPAFVVAKAVGGTVVFWQQDPELDDAVERWVREGKIEAGHYDPAEMGFELRRYTTSDDVRPDDCLRYNEYPWIEIDGYAVNWRHYRVIAAAMVKASAA